MIKNINDLKNIQIFCREEKDVKNCLNMLEKLGFKVFYGSNKCRIIAYSSFLEGFKSYTAMDCSLENCFYNKKFIKTLQNFIKQKEEKEKLKDFEIASDGRIIKVNNYKSEKEVFICSSTEGGDKIKVLHPDWLKHVVEHGLAYTTQEAKDRAIFKLKIETQLKNIAERLNNGRKIDWENRNQSKCRIYYDYNYKKIDWVYTSFKTQGLIHCLDEKFLEVAKKEIGEENLIKYFKEDFN